MAEYIKKLGGTTTVANTTAILYATSATSRAVVSSIAICNYSVTPYLFSLAHIDGPASQQGDPSMDWFAYACNVSPSTTITYQLGITMGISDTLICKASAVSVIFTAWGSEIV